MNVDIIREKFEAHRDFFKQALDIIKKRDTAEFPVSFEVLSGLSSGIEDIFKGMIASANESNLYSCSVLYRSLIEHFFRAFLLINELVQNKSDEASEHYEQHLFLAEFIAEQMGGMEAQDIVSGNTIKSDILKHIKTKFPSLPIDKGVQQEISTATKKFSFKEIIKKLHADFSKGKTDKSVANFFTVMIPEYSRFSTFIHGGPFTQHIIKQASNNSSVDELDRILGISLTASCIVKEHLLMCFKLEREEVFTLLHSLHKLRA